MYKSNIGDYPLKVKPCKYWWVRYAVACVYESEKYREKWEPKLKELMEKYDFDNYSSKGSMDGLGNLEIFLYKKGEEKECPIDLFVILQDKICSEPKWSDCPYENEDQSTCPLYVEDEFYKDRKLRDLRNHKGYNL